MTLNLRKSEQFLSDFEKQFRWYKQKAGLELANKYLAAVDQTLRLVAREPGLGRIRQFPQPELVGIRSFPTKNPFSVHLIFYRFNETEIQIVRIMHGGRDLERRLVESDEEAN